MVKRLPFIFLLCAITVFAQDNKKFILGINGVYTTAAKIYLYPYSSDPVLRNTSFPISDIFNPGIYLKYRLTSDILIGINTEYMTKTSSGSNLTVFSGNKTVTITVQDGFRMIPVELSLYYLLPFSLERWKFMMGGGAAYYYGQHIRIFGDDQISSRETQIAYGIQVSVSMDYYLTDDIIIHGGMKFRDPQFITNNTYDKKTVNYNGNTYLIAQDSFTSKINVDGVAFDLGAAFQF